jgi:hypothetical protein
LVASTADLIHLRRDQHPDRIADDVDAEEHDHDHHADDQHGLPDAPDDEGKHEKSSRREVLAASVIPAQGRDDQCQA